MTEVRQHAGPGATESDAGLHAIGWRLTKGRVPAISEPGHDDALMTLPYRTERMDEADRHFGAATGCVRAGEFSVTPLPEAPIFRECYLRALCRAKGGIGEIGKLESQAA